MTPDIEYRGYKISYNPPPIPVTTMDWQFVHSEYDGPGDQRHGHAATIEAAMREIDDIEDDE